ncbi:MAG: tRNA lysidine(34) synthetase TilS [Beijerinckiaceae bacterium]
MRGVKRRAFPDAASPISDEEAENLFHTWRGAKGVVIAASGGPDSIALLGLATRWRAAIAAPPLIAATFDHGLRPESAREARQVKAFARSLCVDHRTLKWSGEKPASRLQERAREARLAALTRFAASRGCSHLALAHHEDDQAETVLMRLAAGSGIEGLAGMSCIATRDGVILHRPLLSQSKARLVATCRARGWPYVEDPSNADARFARSRWRSLASELAAEGLSSGRLARLAARARRMNDAVERAVEDWLAQHPPQVHRGGLAIPASAWRSAPDELQVRIASRLIDQFGSATPERLERVERLWEDLRCAIDAGRPEKRNLRGVLVQIDAKDHLCFAPEPRRRTPHSS